MKSVLSIGNFDGLHLGHRKLLATLIEMAKKKGLRSVVVTYDNLPAQFLNDHARPMLLMPAHCKKQAMLDMGVDEIHLLHFDEELARTSADDFLHGFIMPRLEPEVIVVGYDSHFGHNREGDLDFLKLHAPAYGYDLHYVKPLQHKGKVVSSTLVRKWLLEGKIELANELTARPYSLFGGIIPGSGIGRQLGFPTANMELSEPQQLVPKNGVYLSRVHLEGQKFFGLTNIGSGPTLKTNGNIEIETFIMGFEGEIYGKPLEVGLLKYLREEKTFASRNDLIDAIDQDLAIARAILERGL